MHQKHVGLSKIALKNKAVYKLELVYPSPENNPTYLLSYF